MGEAMPTGLDGGARLEASISAQREQLSKERIQFGQEKAERDSREATVARRQLLKLFWPTATSTIVTTRQDRLLGPQAVTHAPAQSASPSHTPLREKIPLL